jgi:hypothetical protein
LGLMESFFSNASSNAPPESLRFGVEWGVSPRTVRPFLPIWRSPSWKVPLCELQKKKKRKKKESQ